MINKVEEKYNKIMRKKSGDERLKIAMELRKLALKMAEDEIKHMCKTRFCTLRMM